MPTTGYVFTASKTDAVGFREAVPGTSTMIALGTWSSGPLRVPVRATVPRPVRLRDLWRHESSRWRSICADGTEDGHMINLATLNGIDGFTINGTATKAYAGISLDAAGDVNGGRHR